MCESWAVHTHRRADGWGAEEKPLQPRVGDLDGMVFLGVAFEHQRLQLGARSKEGVEDGHGDYQAGQL